MTDQELAEIDALAKAAGEWVVRGQHIDAGSLAGATFAVAAREAVPALVAEVRRLRILEQVLLAARSKMRRAWEKVDSDRHNSAEVDRLLEAVEEIDREYARRGTALPPA